MTCNRVFIGCLIYLSENDWTMQLKFYSSSIKIFRLVMSWNAGGWFSILFGSSLTARDHVTLSSSLFCLGWQRTYSKWWNKLVWFDNWQTTCSIYLTHVTTIVPFRTWNRTYSGTKHIRFYLYNISTDWQNRFKVKSNSDSQKWSKSKKVLRSDHFKFSLILKTDFEWPNQFGI